MKMRMVRRMDDEEEEEMGVVMGKSRL